MDSHLVMYCYVSVSTWDRLKFAPGEPDIQDGHHYCNQQKCKSSPCPFNFQLILFKFDICKVGRGEFFIHNMFLGELFAYPISTNYANDV